MSSVSGVGSGQPPAVGPERSARTVLVIAAQAIVVVAMAVRCLAAMLVPAVRQVGWPDVVVAIVAAVALVIILATGPRPSRARIAAAVVAALFWLSTLVSALAFDQSVPLAAVGMAVTAVAVILGPGDSPWPLRISVGAGALVAVASLVAGILAVTGRATGGVYGTEVYQRETFGLPALSGIAGHPNTLAQIVGLTLVLSLAVALANRSLATAALPFLVLLPLLWTQSRTSIAAALVAGAVLVLLIRFDRWRPWFVGAALIAAVAPPLLWLRAGDYLPVDAIFTGRHIAWAAAGLAVAVAPLLGQGPEVLSREFWRSLGMSPDEQWQPLHAHNEVLETLAQAGLLGGVSLLALTLVGVVVALQRTGSNGRMCAALLLFLGLQAGVEVPLGLTYFPIGYLLPTMAVSALAFRGSLTREAQRQPPVEQG